MLGSSEKRGIGVCAAGLCCNLLLSAGKIAVGLLFAFVSVTADGFNNLSDCAAGAVALVSFFIAARPADRKHPYGHHRAEYVAAMIAGLLVFFLAAELFGGAIESLVEGSAPSPSTVVYIVLAVSFAVKAGMFFLYRISAKRLDSDVLRAAATDSLCDCLSTLGVIAGAALSLLWAPADGCTGLAVALFILWQGIKLILDAGSKLLGQAPDPALAAKIGDLALSNEEVLGIHDLQIYSYGKGAMFATLHVEMDATRDMVSAHTVIDELEMQVRRETGVRLTVHLDPVDLTDREGSRLKLEIVERARELADGLELHDFRRIPNSNRVEFDVGVPYACRLSDGELAAAIAAVVRELGDYEPIVNIERE